MSPWPQRRIARQIERRQPEGILAVAGAIGDQLLAIDKRGVEVDIALVLSLATAAPISLPKKTLVLLAGHIARQVSTGVALVMCSSGKCWPSHSRTQ